MASQGSLTSETPQRRPANSNAGTQGPLLHDSVVSEGVPGQHGTRTGPGNVRKIALVDDDEDLRRLFSTIASHLGYVVEFVGRDGAGIVRAIADRSIEPDLIL